MEKEHGPPPRAVGSLSRLPILPRASRDNLRAAGKQSQFGSVKSSLPRLAGQHSSSKIIPPVPLGENINRSLVDRYGRTDQFSRQRNRSPVRDALQAAQAASLETTPPNSKNDVPVFEDGQENPVEERPIQKRKPRPSLTERTIETLSQIPPSPSPTRRRGSVASNDRNMGPPSRPASSMRMSRPTTPGGSRPTSPVKQAFKPPGRASPTKEQHLPAVPSPGSLYTPPKAFVKGTTLRGVKSSKELRPAATSVTPAQPSQPTKYSSKTMRAKPSAHASAHRNLEALFKDPEKPATPSRSAQGGSPGLLKPRGRGENTIASSPAKSKTQRHVANSSKPVTSTNNAPAEESTPKSHLKSSAALRETIAKAKAARKSAGTDGRPSAGPGDLPPPAGSYATDDFEVVAAGPGVLKQRIRTATSSGVLNISAMQLKEIPESVLRMYESSDNTTNWSEMVDLTKFIAADNEFEILPETVFSDWSRAEMADDEDKQNQFGGIESLDLHNNLLCELPKGLRQLERLTILNLSGNKLTNAAFETILQIPNLQELNVSRNNLSGPLHLAGLNVSNLRTLNVSENKIEHLTFEAMPSALKVFNISGNRLRHIDWNILSTLPITDLQLSNNALDGQAFEGVESGFGNLRELDLSRNSFTAIAGCIANLTELQFMRVSSNRLTDLPDLSGSQALVTIQASENHLTEIPLTVCLLSKLRNLDVSQNNIKAVIPELAGLETLVALDLAGNPLRDRKYLSMDTADVKQDLKKRLTPADEARTDGQVLESMDDSPPGASASHLFKPINGTLDLTSKALSTIDVTKIDFESATTPIHTLKLSNNDLTALPFELLSHPTLKWTLRSLDVSHNPLLHPTEYLTEDLFLPALQSLYIVSTGMTSLDPLTTYLKAPELAEINISCHRLAGHVPWIRAWFPNCTSLLASDNWFNSIDVEGVRGLEILDIRNNYIEELPRKIGLLGNHVGKSEPGRLRAFECGGNKFRVPRITTIEKGSEAVLKDLRRMIAADEVPEEWQEEM
jgi:Leucine-rich repeat (LRR) protein